MPSDPRRDATAGKAKNNPPTGEPVNPATGNYYAVQQDVLIPVRGAALSFKVTPAAFGEPGGLAPVEQGLTLEFTRTYNAQLPYRGPLGFGWDHNYNRKLAF